MITVLFPNQLFAELLSQDSNILLVEHPLFFRQLPFHQQKLIFHHVSMRSFQRLAEVQGCTCKIVSLERLEQLSILDILKEQNYSAVRFIEPRDDFLSREIKEIAKQLTVTLQRSPGFLTPIREWIEWQEIRKALRMQDFYQWQRTRMNVLMDGSAPAGGKWSFDTENRKSLPKNTLAPEPYQPEYTLEEVADITEAAKRFSEQPGSSDFHYPVNHMQASETLSYFVQHKLLKFGDYEDAVSQDGSVLFHSQVSLLINSGLLTPQQVLDEVLTYSEEHQIPLNSLEGFIRQVIGWREFISVTYLTHGRRMRKSNTLNHHNKLPQRFWEGKTGILPLDSVITAVLKTSYAHHIERLMILGVFMLLTETEPTEAYSWFHAMFIDAYDWVMVPNIYAMSQYADGGILTTKPYLCGSAYLRRMTDFPEGSWCQIWDGLYWRWVSRHQSLLQSNPRTSMSVASWNRFAPQKQSELLAVAEQFLETYYA